MGKLGEYYTKVDSQVELKLPLSEDVMTWHRPSEEEIRAVIKYGNSMDLEEDDSGIKMSAFILKLLCDKPALADENQAVIEADLRKMEAPDRNEVLPFFNEMLGVNREEVSRMVSDRFGQRTRK